MPCLAVASQRAHQGKQKPRSVHFCASLPRTKGSHWGSRSKMVLHVQTPALTHHAMHLADVANLAVAAAACLRKQIMRASTCQLKRKKLSQLVTPHTSPDPKCARLMISSCHTGLGISTLSHIWVCFSHAAMASSNQSQSQPSPVVRQEASAEAATGAADDLVQKLLTTGYTESPSQSPRSRKKRAIEVSNKCQAAHPKRTRQVAQQVIRITTPLLCPPQRNDGFQQKPPLVTIGSMTVQPRRPSARIGQPHHGISRLHKGEDGKVEEDVRSLKVT